MWVFFPLSPALAAEVGKGEQVKAPGGGQNTVENGNQGLTNEEIMQKNREQFFRKRMGAPVEKPR